MYSRNQPSAHQFLNPVPYQSNTRVILLCDVEGTVENERGVRVGLTLPAGSAVFINKIRYREWEMTHSGVEIEARPGCDITYDLLAPKPELPWFDFFRDTRYGPASIKIPHSQLTFVQHGPELPREWEPDTIAYLRENFHYNSRGRQVINTGEPVFIFSKPLSTTGNPVNLRLRGSANVFYDVIRATKARSQDGPPIWRSNHFLLPGVFRLPVGGE